MRKLAIAAGAFSFAVITANFIGTPLLIWVLVAFFATAGCFMLPKRKEKLWLAAVIAAFSLALGFLCFRVNYLSTVERAKSVSGIEQEYSALVLDYPAETDSYSRVALKLRGNACKGLKAYVYDYDGRLSDLRPGMEIRFSSALLYVGDERYENYDYLLASGFYLRGTFESCVYASTRINYIRVFPAIIKHAILTACTECFPEDTAPFFISLLTGDKTELYNTGSVYIDLSRAGFVHIVAVSGMHVAFVAGLFQTLFGKNRKLSLFCVALIWLFILVTGSSPSAVRSGIMQTVMLMAPVFKRESDPLTSIFLALAMILSANPFSAMSVSLQLSFGATLGILLFSKRVNFAIISCFKTPLLKKLFKYPAGIVAVSIAASCFTVPLCIIHYGIISLISPVTNVLALWAVSVCFVGAAAVCGVYSILPALGTFLGRILSFFARYIFTVCHVLARIPFSTVYTDGVAVIALILIYACIVLIALSKDSPAFKFILSAVSFCTLIALYFTFSFLYARLPRAVYSAVDVGQGQCIVATAGDRSVIVDCGSSSYDYDAGINAADWLRMNCIFSVDALVLTHLHSDHANGIECLLQYIDVGAIVLPGYTDSSDLMYLNILDAAKEKGVKIYLINERCRLNIGDIALELYPPLEITSSENEDCMAIKVSVDDFDMLLTGDSDSNRELSLISEDDFSDVEVLVAGHHGSKTSSCQEFLNSIGGEIALISVGEDNRYGHPYADVLERLKQNNFTVFRTDLNGTVSVRYID